VLLLGSFQFRSEPWDWRFWGKATREGSVDYRNWIDTQKRLIGESASTGESTSRLELAWTLHDIFSHPLIRAKMFLVRVLALNVWTVGSTKPSDFDLGPFRGRSAYVGFHVIANSIALLSIIASAWFLICNRTQFFTYWPLWGSWLGLLLFHAFTYSEPRYMLPAQPGLVVMTSAFLADRLKNIWHE
jgi:hypothetical protein